uniref:Uncharacterized protein n=1 Tax=Piliocolobus tephrosceles TaxID=591936 RepID=A0A8C9IYH5_9PRIM
MCPSVRSLPARYFSLNASGDSRHPDLCPCPGTGCFRSPTLPLLSALVGTLSWQRWKSQKGGVGVSCHGGGVWGHPLLASKGAWLRGLLDHRGLGCLGWRRAGPGIWDADLLNRGQNPRLGGAQLAGPGPQFPERVCIVGGCAACTFPSRTDLPTLPPPVLGGVEFSQAR